MNLRVLSPALEEIAQAAEWFESQRAGLGNEFWQSVNATLVDIEANPLLFAKSEFATTELDFRFAIIRRFNFVIHYLVESSEAQIVAVAHAARKPGYWLSRAKR